VHLNLSSNLIGDAGTESLSGVLVQCPALVHLYIKGQRVLQEFWGSAECTACSLPSV
jgi:hypothetical protein